MSSETNNEEQRPPAARKLTRSQAMVVEEEEEENFQGVQDLIEFIKNTLNKSVKDRNIIFRIETDLIQFVKDGGRSNLPFPSMSSYHRMLVHRISTIFELDHNIDPIGNCVVVSKNNGKNGKLLNFRFKELIKENEQKITIIQREFQSRGKEQMLGCVEKSKSYEERTEDYNKIRRRIFDEEIWSGQKKNQQKLIKVESFETGIKKLNNKSNSFGGYQPKINGFKQDSSSSLSPASSGYRSQQSFNCDLVSPPPPQQVQPIISQNNTLPISSQNKVLWAVTDLAHLPPGAILIDPLTGQSVPTAHAQYNQQQSYEMQYNQYYMAAAAAANQTNNIYQQQIQQAHAQIQQAHAQIQQAPAQFSPATAWFNNQHVQQQLIYVPNPDQYFKQTVFMMPHPQRPDFIHAQQQRPEYVPHPQRPDYMPHPHYPPMDYPPIGYNMQPYQPPPQPQYVNPLQYYQTNGPSIRYRNVPKFNNKF